MFIPPEQTRISKIQVHASLKFPDPYEKFCGHQLSLSLDAFVGDEDPEVAVRRLQAQVHRLVEEHRQRILTALSPDIQPPMAYPTDPGERAARSSELLPEVSGHADPDH
jgi:hypothetical protein